MIVNADEEERKELERARSKQLIYSRPVGGGTKNDKTLNKKGIAIMFLHVNNIPGLAFAFCQQCCCIS